MKKRISLEKLFSEYPILETTIKSIFSPEEAEKGLKRWRQMGVEVETTQPAPKDFMTDKESAVWISRIPQEVLVEAMVSGVLPVYPPEEKVFTEPKDEPEWKRTGWEPGFRIKRHDTKEFDNRYPQYRETFRHTEGYETVWLNGVQHDLTPNWRGVIKLLDEARLRGEPDKTFNQIMSEEEKEGKRSYHGLQEYLKRHWDEHKGLIKMSGIDRDIRRARYRLNL